MRGAPGSPARGAERAAALRPGTRLLPVAAAVPADRGCLSSLVRTAFHLASALTARALDKWRRPTQVKSILTFASGVTGL